MKDCNKDGVPQEDLDKDESVSDLARDEKISELEILKQALEEKEVEAAKFLRLTDEKISELEILKQALDEKSAEAANFFEQLLRLKADFANYRQRNEKEKSSDIEWGKAKILAKQISILDVLEQAEKSIKMGGKPEDIIIGLDMINKEFLKILVEEGVEEIKIEKFDPTVCEALDYVEGDKDDGEILEIYQKGYTINGKLLRPAKVKVAKKKVSNIKIEEEQDHE